MKHRFNNKVEFYITNVCNLTCDSCNRFNNYRFSGWQSWNDYADTYQQWSQYIELPNIVIMGGEPLLNPTVCDWISGLHSVFGSSIQVLSNGLQLTKVKGLYQALVNNQGHVGISLHNVAHFDMIRQNIGEFLSSITEELEPPMSPNQPRDIYYSARDVNNVLVNVYLSRDFQQAAVIAKPDGSFTLHQSDPAASHSMCGFARYKCYHFIRGKLYKCGPVALFPEFDQQFCLDLDTQDRELINSYQAMSPALWPTLGQKFMQEIDQPIAQCKFCPSQASMRVIHPVVKTSLATK